MSILLTENYIKVFLYTNDNGFFRLERRCGIMTMHILRIPSHPSHAPHPPHILRFAAYVRGYGDSVFQTRWIMWLSILASPASPRTYSAPLRMYGVTEIASSRRIKQKRHQIALMPFLILDLIIILGLRHHCCYCGDGGEVAQDGRLSQDALPQLSQDVEAMLCVIA